MRNRTYRSAMRTEVKKFNAAVEAADVELACGRLASVSRQLDKMVTQGIIHKNQAARRKSRMARRLSAMSPAPA